MLAGHANITTTQCYTNVRANSLAESMRQARNRRSTFALPPSRYALRWTRRATVDILRVGVSSLGVPSEARRRRAKDGGEGQNRTVDTTIFSRMLYQLSYLAADSRS